MKPDKPLPEAVAASGKTPIYYLMTKREKVSSISDTCSHLTPSHFDFPLMKSFSKFPLLLLMLGFLLCTSNVVKAQSSLCEDPCPPGALQWAEIPLCWFTLDPGSTPAGYNSADFQNVPYVFVHIGYRLRTCNGVTSIIIDDYVFDDHAESWFNNYFVTPPNTMPTYQPLVEAVIANSGCAYNSSSGGSYGQPTQAQIKQGIKDAIEKLLAQVGNPAQANYDIYFKGSCRSLVSLSFPTGSYFVYGRGDLPGFDTVYTSSYSTIVQSIPCDPGCCKVSYNWRTVTLANGETISKWVAVSSASDAGAGSCENQPLPDYSNYPNKLEANAPGGGTVTGTVVSQSSCTIMCSYFYSPPPSPEAPLASVGSDIVSQDQALQITAAPMPFDNFIRLSGNKAINNSVVVVYDINGKKVLNTSCLENGQLNTSELKTGVYFIHVLLPDNTLKTIKAIKQ